MEALEAEPWPSEEETFDVIDSLPNDAVSRTAGASSSLGAPRTRIRTFLFD